MPDKSSTPIPLAVLHRGLDSTKQRCEVDGVSLPSLAVSVRTTGEVDTQSPDSEDVSDTPAEFASGVRARTNVVTGHVSESPRQETAANEVAERRARRRGLVQMSALCWMMFLIGWNDGSQGPLLPRIQKAYGINFIVVSLAFVGASAGIIIGGLANIYIAQKLSFGKILVAAPLLTICGYAIQAPAPPFPIFVVATGIVGFSVTLQDIHGNNYVAHMQKSSSRLGVLHCAYGVGAFAAPLVATQFAQLHHWSFLYIISLSIAALNVIVVAFVFRFRSLENCLLDMGDPPQQTDAEIGNPYSQLIRFKGLYFLSIFILLYVGAEVTIGGWIVTYTIDIRHGGPSAGYISSGFFGGLALGRVLLLPLTKLLGNRLAVLCYVLLAMGLEFIVWFVPSLVSGAVAIAIAGLFLGPIYPVTVQQAGLLFPRGLLNGAISVLAAFATTGGAGLPLAAGLLAQSKGIWSLQPLLVSIMAAMAGLWLVIPKTRSHID